MLSDPTTQQHCLDLVGANPDILAGFPGLLGLQAALGIGESLLLHE